MVSRLERERLLPSLALEHVPFVDVDVRGVTEKLTNEF